MVDADILSGLYFLLGVAVPNCQTTTLFDSRLSKKHLLSIAIDHNPTDSNLYSYLGNCLKYKDPVIIEDEQVTSPHLLKKSIELNPNNAEGFYGLCESIIDEQQDKVLSDEQEKEIYNRSHQSIQKAIEMVSNDFKESVYLNEILSDYYTRLVSINPESCKLNGEVVTKEHLYSKIFQLSSNKARAYFKISKTIYPDNPKISLNGEELDQVQLLLKAIEIDKNNDKYYYHVAQHLNDGKTAVFEGATMTKFQFYQKAIELNPECGDYYYFLALHLKGDETAIINGIPMSEKEIYIKAISVYPYNPFYYKLLARRMCACDDDVTLADGTVMTQRDLILKAIDIAPNLSETYAYLAETIGSREMVILLDGRAMNRNDLYEKAISLNPCDGSYYYEYASKLSSDVTVMIGNNRMDKIDLLVTSIHYDNEYADAYNLLGYTLIENSQDEAIIINEKPMNYLDCFLKAVELDPSNAVYYCNIGATLNSPDKLVTLPDGTEMNQQQLYVKAIDLDPYEQDGYFHLIKTLSNDDTITLYNATIMTKFQLLRYHFLLRLKEKTRMLENSQDEE